MAVDKLVDSTQLDTDLTSVANAIRAKSGGSGQLAFPAGFVSEIGNIPSGGGVDMIELLANGQAADYVNNNLTAIVANGLANVRLTSFSAPNVTSIGNSAFENSKIPTVTLGDITTLSYRAFRGSTLKTINIDFTKITSIGGSDVFYTSGIELQYANFANLIGTVPGGLFGGGKVIVVDFGEGVTALSGYNHWTSNYTQAVIFRNKNAVVTMDNISAFNNVNWVKNGVGHVYVPNALLTSYKTETNWSTLNASYPDLLQPIEGSDYE